MTWSTRCAAVCAMCLPLQDGHTPRRLHEKFKILDRASVAQWPKLFVNLRASRETELMRSEPAHVVHAWLGNSREFAEHHFLMVTDEDFERASKETAEFNAEVAARGRLPAS